MPLKPLLFLSPRVPWPQNNGAKIRTHALLSALRARFEVDYAGFLQPDITRQQALAYLNGCRSMALFPERATTRPAKAWHFLSTACSRKPVTIAKYWHLGLAELVRVWMAEHPNGIIHADHLHMAPYLELGQTALRVMDEHNVESVIFERLAEQYEGRLAHPYLQMQARRMRRLEAELAGRVDLATCVSRADADELAAMAPHACVEVIPNGVDLDYFAPPPDGRNPVPGRLVFTGTMSWLPNHDGMLYFLREIYPLLGPFAGGCRWTLDIVGQQPLPALRALDAAGVRVTGTVEDVRPYVHEAMIYIVPLRVGGGSRLKILEAFAMGIPVVSTTVGCEGLETVPGRHLLVADTPAEFARAIERLAADPELRENLAAAALQHARERFAWPAIARRLVARYEEV